jgi:hypothetical protein
MRPLDWRWRRALVLTSERRRLASRTDDEETLRAARFLRAWHHCRNKKERDQVARIYHHVYEAWRFDANGGWQRAESRARLLANEPIAAIASRTGLAVDVIERFESLFFNVLDRLRAKDWIVTRVIGTSLVTAFSPRDIDKIWMSFGYAGGPIALDMAIAGSRQCGLAPAATGKTTPDVILSDRQLRSLRRAIWAMMVPATAPLRQFAEAMVQIRQREARLANQVPESKPANLTADSPSQLVAEQRSTGRSRRATTAA